VIRAATPDDAAAIGSMHAQAWVETYPGLVPDALFTEMTDAARRRAAWAHNLARPLLPGGTLVAEEAGDILGFIAVCAARDPALGASGEVAGLYLLRRAQGRGLGRALLAAGAALLRDAGHGSAGAWALDSNVRAQGFYAATGAVAGTRQVGWHGEVAIPETAWVWPDLRIVTT
jgi:GNAT superfamily N-acetyltransferase